MAKVGTVSVDVSVLVMLGDESEYLLRALSVPVPDESLEDKHIREGLWSALNNDINGGSDGTA